MVFKKGSSGDAMDMESESWNVAKGYTQLRILKPMLEIDRYEQIAKYGAYDIDESVNFTPDMINQRRVEALDRLLSMLKQILDNVDFAIKKEDRPKFVVFNKRLEGVRRVFGGVSYHYENMITHDVELRINERLFEKCLDILREVKKEMNIPINKAGLIFRVSDEINLEDMMSDIVHGG